MCFFSKRNRNEFLRIADGVGDDDDDDGVRNETKR